MKATFLRSNLINLLKTKQSSFKLSSSTFFFIPTRHILDFHLHCKHSCPLSPVGPLGVFGSISGLFLNAWLAASPGIVLQQLDKRKPLPNTPLPHSPTFGIQACRASEFRTRCPGCEPLQLTKDLRFTCWVCNSSPEWQGLTHWCLCRYKNNSVLQFIPPTDCAKSDTTV